MEPTHFPAEGWSKSLGASSNPSPVLGSTARNLALSGEVGGPAGMYTLPAPGARKWCCGQYRSLQAQGEGVPRTLSPAGRVLLCVDRILMFEHPRTLTGDPVSGSVSSFRGRSPSWNHGHRCVCAVSAELSGHNRHPTALCRKFKDLVLDGVPRGPGGHSDCPPLRARCSSKAAPLPKAPGLFWAAVLFSEVLQAGTSVPPRPHPVDLCPQGCQEQTEEGAGGMGCTPVISHPLLSSAPPSVGFSTAVSQHSPEKESQQDMCI